jgi:hypothetical protein
MDSNHLYILRHVGNLDVMMFPRLPGSEVEGHSKVYWRSRTFGNVYAPIDASLTPHPREG